MNGLLGASAQANVLQVCVLEARDLVAGDSDGTSDPFVNVRFSGQEFKTQVRKNARGRASWDEKVKFVAARNPLTAVEFKVYDEDNIGKDMLGKAEIDVNTVREMKQQFAQNGTAIRQIWLDLKDKYGTEGNFGKLRVTIGFVHQVKVSGKSRLAVMARLGITKKTTGEFLDVLPELDGEELDDEVEDSEWDTDHDEGAPHSGGAEPLSAAEATPSHIDEDGFSSDDETKKKAKEKMLEEQLILNEKLEAARKKPIKAGTWRVIFDVVEVRELKAEDLQGTSDPVCVVTVETPLRKPVKRSTSIKKGVRSCVFDEKLFLDLPDMNEEALEATTIRFAVYDADLITRNDLIGSFTFDLLDSYYTKRKKQWIGLVDEKNVKDKGIQGYAKVSVTVLGPGDSAEMPSESGEEEAKDSSKDVDGDGDDVIGEVLLPPNVEQPLNFLRVKFYQAEDLPALDSNRVTGVSGIDAFVSVQFDSNPKIRSRVISKSRPRGSTESLRVVFNEEFWLPTFNHRIAKGIKISMFDYDKSSKNDLVGTLLLNYQDVIKASRERIRPRWYNLYGAPGQGGIFGNSDRHKMNCNPSLGSAYRGRLLVGLQNTKIDDDDSSHTEIAHKVPIRSIRRAVLPREVPYTLRIWAISGSEIPKMQGALIKTKADVALALSIGNQSIRTTAQRPKKGQVKWGESLELEVNLPEELLDRWKTKEVQDMVSRYDELNAKLADMKSRVVRARISSSLSNAREGSPSSKSIDRVQKQVDLLRNWILTTLQEAQVPDVFLYLEDPDQESISFRRFKPEVLLLDRMACKPEWIALQEDNANNKLDDEDFAGNVQIAIGLGSAETSRATSDSWTQERLKTLLSEQLFNVRVNIYQGADLPAADSSGLCDPYAIVKCMGTAKKIPKRKKTCDPLWYETVEFSQVALPEVDISPQVIIDLYDYDKFDSDDYLGTARIPVAETREYMQEGNPNWWSVFQVSPGDTGKASLLVSIDVFPVGSPLPPLRSIEPSCPFKAKLQIAVLGLRQLKSFHGVSAANPLVEFHLGDASKVRNVKRTKRGKGSNPNFGELVELSVQLPDDLVFLPRLHVTVKDSRFGGLDCPTIATSTIDLQEFVPTKVCPDEESTRMQFSISDHGVNPNVNEEESSVELLTLLQSPVGQDVAKETFGSSELERETRDADEEEDDDEEEEEASSEVDEDGRDESPEKFVEWPNHDPLPLPKYMNGRETISVDLERQIGTGPFTNFPLFRGSTIRKSLLGRKLKPNYRQVGALKAVIRILLEDEASVEDSTARAKASDAASIFNPDMLEKLMIPRLVQVRLYVLKGFNFTPMDICGGKSDPYLIVKLGREKMSDRKNYIPNSVNPSFYKCFEMAAQLPGTSLLCIKAMDYDSLSSDDLIGETFIDIEDRWFSQTWQNLCFGRTKEERSRAQLSEEEISEIVGGSDTLDASVGDVPAYFRKPVELRSLWTPTSQLEQGKLELWCDLMEQPTAIKYPKVNIAPPKDVLYEMRVIIWKSEDVPSFDMFTKQNDLYVRANFNGWSEKKWVYTDTHWRCKKGKGSWNYRLKFKDIALPLSKLKSRLTLQIWDKDVTKWNDCIAETILDLDSHLKAAFLRNEETYQVFGDHSQRSVQAPQEDKSPISTEETFVQPPGVPTEGLNENSASASVSSTTDNAFGGGRANAGRTLSEISITIDPYSGIPNTNAEADDVNFAKKTRPKTNKPTKVRKNINKSELSSKQSGGDEDERRQDAHDLIDTYAPWAREFAGSTRSPPNSKALKLFSIEEGKKRDMGVLWVSVELVRKDVAETSLSNGSGQSEPNRFPKLPKPTGRLKWSLMWNPFYLLRECLGPELCMKFCLCFIVLAAIVITIFLFPQVSGFISFITSTGALGYTILALVVVAVLGGCCYCFISDRIRARKEEQSIEYDLEAQRDPRQSSTSSDPREDEDVKNCCRCCYRKQTSSTTKRVDPQSQQDQAELELLTL